MKLLQSIYSHAVSIDALLRELLHVLTYMVRVGKVRLNIKLL